MGGAAETAPCLDVQLKFLVRLYDSVVEHYGARVGLRHARKHLSWALDVASSGTASSAQTIKRWRQNILTSTDPAEVRKSLHDAFEDFAWSIAA